MMVGSYILHTTMCSNFTPAPEPMFEQPMYTVPENNRTVPLCIDVGVVVSQDTEYTITASNKNPPEAQGKSIYNKKLHNSTEKSHPLYHLYRS